MLYSLLDKLSYIPSAFTFLFAAIAILTVVLIFIALALTIIISITEWIQRRKNEKERQIDSVIKTLTPHDWPAVKKLNKEVRLVHCGLLSVGLKLHCSGESNSLAKKLNLDSSRSKYFKLLNAGTCIVLPPVGSARAAIALIELLEKASGIKIFQNPEIQIQVCTPGRLSNENAAMLAAAFYLGTDMLKRFGKEDHYTTQRGFTYDRLVIYDHKGDFEKKFAWWAVKKGKLEVQACLPFDKDRTDVLGCRTRDDIYNVNLAASLLVHAQHGGYWKDAGLAFAAEIQQMFLRHQLGGTLKAVWVKKTLLIDLYEYEEEDLQYFDRLAELMDYVFDELGRILQSRNLKKEDSPNSILFETTSLLTKYMAIVESKHTTQEK